MSREPQATRAARTRELTVVRAGPLTTVQDLGRPGLAALGVPRSGAADRPALMLANRLVGNAESAAGFEATLGGLVLRFTSAATIAVTGAAVPVSVDQRPEPTGVPLTVPAEATLSLGTPMRGLRTYVAVRGGLDVAPVLGSRATDVLSGLGPPPPREGDVLPIGSDVAGAVPALDMALHSSPPSDPIELRVRLGPRDDRFPAETLRSLDDATWTVTPQSNRIGLRLAGPDLVRVDDRELASEGMVLGAVQVPPSGQPVLFLADHPVTGGYPVIAVVRAADVALAAQARPGDRLRLRTGG